MKKIKDLSLKTMFVLISTLLVLSIMGFISFLIFSSPNETFIGYFLNFMKGSIYVVGYFLLIFTVVFVLMHYLTKIYKTVFK